MNINLIVVGKLKEDYLRNACAEYVKRLGRYGKTEIRELEECRLSDSPSPNEIAAALKKEAVQIKNTPSEQSFPYVSRENSFPARSFRNS